MIWGGIVPIFGGNVTLTPTGRRAARPRVRFATAEFGEPGMYRITSACAL